MITELPKWDEVVDVVVVGSGGAALTAATLAHPPLARSRAGRAPPPPRCPSAASP